MGKIFAGLAQVPVLLGQPQPAIHHLLSPKSKATTYNTVEHSVSVPSSPLLCIFLSPFFLFLFVVDASLHRLLWIATDILQGNQQEQMGA
jgi:hypothetical protein